MAVTVACSSRRRLPASTNGPHLPAKPCEGLIHDTSLVGTPAELSGQLGRLIAQLSFRNVVLGWGGGKEMAQWKPSRCFHHFHSFLLSAMQGYLQHLHDPHGRDKGSMGMFFWQDVLTCSSLPGRSGVHGYSNLLAYKIVKSLSQGQLRNIIEECQRIPSSGSKEFFAGNDILIPCVVASPFYLDNIFSFYV